MKLQFSLATLLVCVTVFAFVCAVAALIPVSMDKFLFSLYWLAPVWLPVPFVGIVIALASAKKKKLALAAFALFVAVEVTVYCLLDWQIRQIPLDRMP